MKALNYLKNKVRFIIAFVVCCFIFTSCEPFKDCHYEIYQNGIKIDEVTRKNYDECSPGNSDRGGIYYKNIKK